MGKYILVCNTDGDMEIVARCETKELAIEKMEEMFRKENQEITKNYDKGTYNLYSRLGDIDASVTATFYTGIGIEEERFISWKVFEV